MAVLSLNPRIKATFVLKLLPLMLYFVYLSALQIGSGYSRMRMKTAPFDDLFLRRKLEAWKKRLLLSPKHTRNIQEISENSNDRNLLKTIPISSCRKEEGLSNQK